MNQKRRMIAIFIIVFLYGSMFFSSAYIFENIDHNCTGEDCPICIQIVTAVQIISNFKLLLPIISIMMMILCVFTQCCTLYKDSNVTTNTLITLKVELLD